MAEMLRKIFGIYPGETAHALRFMRLALFWAFGTSCLETLSDALFLEHVGASLLPRAYLTIALGMVGVSTVVLWSLKSVSPYRILTVAMSLGILLCLTASGILLTSPPEWFWYGLKIGSRMFFSVMIAVSWTFIDQYHDLQDAKRVYALYSAAYFLGMVLAGATITFLLDHVGFSGLLLLAAVSVGTAFAQARKIAFRTKAMHDDSTEGIFSGSRDSFSSVVQLIFRSRFAIYLLLLSLVTQLLITVTEFNYMASFGARQGAQIAEFLGSCRAWIALGNIVMGLFFYGRFVRRFGLQNAILITPVFFAGVYGGWVAWDTMAVAVLGLIAVDGILFTIEDNCFNLLSNAVPSKLKSKVRIVNDSFFEPVGMLLSSLMLFGLPGASRWLGLSLSVLSLMLTLLLRSSYGTAILSTLKDNAVHFDRTFRAWLSSLSRREQKEAKSDVFKALQLGSEESQILAIEGLLQLEEISVLPEILRAADSLGTLAKIQALRLLETSSFASHADVIELINGWSQSESSPELVKWSKFYLAKRGFHESDPAEENLDHPDLLLRGVAILSLSTHPLARTKRELMLRSINIEELSVGLDLATVQEALPFLTHESVLVKRAAARCIARNVGPTDRVLCSLLIRELSARDNVFRLSLLEALGKIGVSSMLRELLLASTHFRPNERRKTEEIVVRMGQNEMLLTLTKDLTLPDRARILAGKILARTSLPDLQEHLIEILDIELERAYFYFYFGHTIQKNYPVYDLSLLQNALLTGYQSVIDFIIHLLGAAGSLEDPSLLVRALHSKNAKVHSHAVESLERTCDVRIFRLIAPLIDDLPLSEKMHACLAWQGDFPKLTLSELLDKLEKSPALFDKVAATKLKAQLQVPGWKQQLQQRMLQGSPEFNQFAHELLKYETV